MRREHTGSDTASGFERPRRSRPWQDRATSYGGQEIRTRPGTERPFVQRGARGIRSGHAPWKKGAASRTGMVQGESRTWNRPSSSERSWSGLKRRSTNEGEHSSRSFEKPGFKKSGFKPWQKSGKPRVSRNRSGGGGFRGREGGERRP
jgi:hypothetical protein